jgi:tripartite-type tricarboxylate transporter receptor subunit TctC
MRCKTRVFSVLTLLWGFGCLLFFSSFVHAQAPYYQGKTITIVRGGEPGGSGDMQARALIPFLKKHIPGNPTIIIENMPGAAGMKAVNHIYAPPSPTGFRSPQSVQGWPPARSWDCRGRAMTSIN